MDDIHATDKRGRWLTYAELAELRGITRKAAIRMTQRHKWRRQPGNDGAARVFVPLDDVARRQTPRPAPQQTPRQTSLQSNPPPLETPRQTSRPDGDDDTPGATSFHAQALEVLENALTEANKRADSAIALADRLGSQLADAGKRADALQTVIDELRASQTLMAETHARDLAAAIQQAQDAAEETVRQRVEQLEHDRAASVAIADEAVRAAEQLRQAAEDGKGRGRWARLRAAWRGE